MVILKYLGRGWKSNGQEGKVNMGRDRIRKLNLGTKAQPPPHIFVAECLKNKEYKVGETC